LLLKCCRKKIYNLHSKKRSTSIIEKQVKEVKELLDSIELVIF